MAREILRTSRAENKNFIKCNSVAYEVSYANLRILLNEVKVFNNEDGGIDVVPEFNGDFRY